MTFLASSRSGRVTDRHRDLLASLCCAQKHRQNKFQSFNLILIKNNSMNSVNHCINAIVKKFKQMLTTLNNSLSKWVCIINMTFWIKKIPFT